MCGVSFSKASIRSNFLETKIYNFLHTHTHHERVHHQKVTRCRGQLLRPSPFSPSSLSFYFAPWLRFMLLHTPFFLFLIASQPTRIFIAFHRSFVSILDRSIDSYDICLQMLRRRNRIFTSREPNSFCGIIFSFVFFLVSFVRRDRCYFFHRVENGRSLGRLLEIF